MTSERTPAPVPARSELLPCPFCGSEGKLFPEVCSDKNPSEVIGDAQVNCKGCGALVHDMTSDDAAAMWNRRSPIAPTAVKAEPELMAGLCPRCAGTGKDTYSTGIQCWKCSGTGAVVIRSALSLAAEPAPMESDEPARDADEAVNFVLDHLAKALGLEQWAGHDGSETWDGDVVATLYGILRDSKAIDPETDEPAAKALYRRPQPAEGWREALTLIRHFADTINERNHADQRLYLLQHIDRLLASPAEGEQQ